MALIIRPTDPVKEELRRKTIKMHQFVSRIIKKQGLHFLDVREIHGLQLEDNTASEPSKF